MPRTWQQMLSAIREDHGSGASVLLGRAIEAGRLFLIATRSRPPGRLAPLLARFTGLLKKWLLPALVRFWRPRDESPAEVTSLRHPNLHVHNRYFDRSALRPLTGLVWEEGIAAPSEVRRRTAEIAISKGLMAVLKQRDGKRRP